MVAERMPADHLRTIERTLLALVKLNVGRGHGVFVVQGSRGREALVRSMAEGHRETHQVIRVVNRSTIYRLVGLGLIKIDYEAPEVELPRLAGMVTPAGVPRAPYRDTGRKVTLTDKGKNA